MLVIYKYFVLSQSQHKKMPKRTVFFPTFSDRKYLRWYNAAVDVMQGKQLLVVGSVGAACCQWFIRQSTPKKCTITIKHSLIQNLHALESNWLTVLGQQPTLLNSEDYLNSRNDRQCFFCLHAGSTKNAQIQQRTMLNESNNTFFNRYRKMQTEKSCAKSGSVKNSESEAPLAPAPATRRSRFLLSEDVFHQSSVWDLADKGRLCDAAVHPRCVQLKTKCKVRRNARSVKLVAIVQRQKQTKGLTSCSVFVDVPPTDTPRVKTHG